jgi:hypothetical protein
MQDQACSGIPNASSNNEYFAVTYFNEEGGSTSELIKSFIFSPKEMFPSSEGIVIPPIAETPVV